MKLNIKKIIFHTLLVTVSVLFFFYSPVLHHKLSFKDSTLSRPSSLPPATKDARFHVDGVRLIQDKNEIYTIWGWGFLTLDSKISPLEYKRTLLFVSEDDTIELPLMNIKRKDIHELFSSTGIDLLRGGFSGDFPLNAIPNGRYNISLAFYLPDDFCYRKDSKFVLIKTFNTIKIVNTGLKK